MFMRSHLFIYSLVIIFICYGLCGCGGNPVIPIDGKPGCEPDDNNVWDSPAVPSIGLSATLTETVCSPLDKDDWFKFTIAGSVRGTLELYITNSSGEATITLFDQEEAASGMIPLAWATATTQPETAGIIDLTEGMSSLLTTGTYYLRIRHIGTSTNPIEYSLKSEMVEDPVNNCNPDLNNSYLDAVEVGFGQTSGTQYLCNPNDVADWYKFKALGELTGSLRLTVANQSGMVKMTLFGEEQVADWTTSIAAQAAAGPGYQTTIDLGGINPQSCAGSYYIHIELLGSNTGVAEYSFVNNAGEVLKESGYRDYFNAKDLGFGESSGPQKVCSYYKTDWYKFTASGPVSGTLDLAVSNMTGPVSIALYEGTYQFPNSSYLAWKQAEAPGFTARINLGPLASQPGLRVYYIEIKSIGDDPFTRDYELINHGVEGAVDFNPQDVTPPWISFSPQDVTVEGNYLYVPAGVSGLNIFDISNPEEPILKNGINTAGVVTHVAVEDGYAYVVDNIEGLYVFDIDPVNAAHLVTRVDTLEAPNNIVVSDGYAYLACEYGMLEIFDINPPEATSEVGIVYIGGFVRDVEVADGYAYVSGSLGFFIVDIDPVIEAHIIKELDTYQAMKSQVRDGYAYLISYEYFDYYFTIIDIDPIVSAQIVFTTKVNSDDISISGNYAYLSSGSHVEIYDISSPEDANQVFSTGLDDFIEAVEAADGYLYIAMHDTGLQIWDVDPVTSSFEATHIFTKHPTYAATRFDGYVCTTGEDPAFQIIDTDPVSSGRVISSLDEFELGSGVKVKGAYAYIADCQSGLKIIDIGSPEFPEVISTVDTPGSALDVAVSMDYAFIADWDAGVQIVDITSATSAHIINSIDTPGNAAGITLEGGYAFIADSGSGLQIVDIDPIDSAHIVKSVEIQGKPCKVDISRGYAFIANLNSSVDVIDIDPIETAHLVKTFYTEGQAEDISIFGGYAYLLSFQSGLFIYDIDPLESPHIVGSYNLVYLPEGLVGDGQFVYLASYEYGLRIIQLWE